MSCAFAAFDNRPSLAQGLEYLSVCRPTESSNVLYIDFLGTRPNRDTTMGKVEPIKDNQVLDAEETTGSSFHVVAVPEHSHRGRRPSFLTETILNPQAPPTHEPKTLAGILKKIGGESEKHTEPKSKYRALIQKAAQRTIMIVRAKHSAQTVQKITVRFSTHQPTELPRTVKLPLLKEKIICHNRYDDERKGTQLFRDVFESSPELEAIIKDMFWYIVSSEFQDGKHAKLEQDFYDRVADNFTALFIRLQMNHSTRDSGVMDKLPDAMSQLLFLALHDAFPISRILFDDDMRKKLITICYSWFVGFVPSKVSWSHWLPELSMQSQRKSASLNDFPALRNRMRRAERLEKIKTIENQNHQRSIKLKRSEELEEEAAAEAAARPAPPRTTHALPSVSQRIKCNERATYSLRNSPLITTFLRRHNLENNAQTLNVDLRLTNDSEHHLNKQEALHMKGGVMQRRRPVLDATSYTELVTKFEAYGKELKHQYVKDKAAVQQENDESKALYAAAQKHLSDQYTAITTRSQGVHELSNVLVSKAQSTERERLTKHPRPPPHHGAARLPGAVRHTAT
ncbi:Aste57867_11780 [Aphanomyces stellatus]|uniref:Aste57867_11780 protein n=1 Tax=Aphanomyces stellatus TaxID=120398 RepID=A0A485KTW3_9STRA|nr:hypothetical protein As57867_011735 [Aphanomyces stellatus]VFT88636.1 Aste57867_11780 [Aphanomyces stellatus]